MNTTMRQPIGLVVVVVISTAAWLTGCGQGGGGAPSQSDLAQEHKSEVDHLARLEQDREAMIVKFKADLGATEGEALQAFNAFVEASTRADYSPIETDPQVALTNEASEVEKAQASLATVLAGLTGAGREVAAETKQLAEDFQKTLSGLDRDIAEQRRRVSQAKRRLDGVGE